MEGIRLFFQESVGYLYILKRGVHRFYDCEKKIVLIWFVDSLLCRIKELMCFVFQLDLEY